MNRVVVLSTGGTIASRPNHQGGNVAVDGAQALLDRISGIPAVPVEAEDILCMGSYLLTPQNMLDIARSIRRALRDPAVLGVVVTHGTDSMEETAFLADLVHDGCRPVVFTGAQRAASAPDSDGPRNLADAISVAACPQAAGHGVLVVFDGSVFPARGVRKSHTLASAAFTAPDSGPVGQVRAGSVSMSALPSRARPFDLAALDLRGIRVDIVACYPGADATALDAAVGAGAQGVVLQGTGAGNANHAVCEAVARSTRVGVVVALSTRVSAGTVVGLYGDGGGADLLAAGAIPVGTLRPSQARMLLLALLGRDSDPVRVAAALRAWQPEPPPTTSSRSTR